MTNYFSIFPRCPLVGSAVTKESDVTNERESFAIVFPTKRVAAGGFFVVLS
jgi:hypothetical protein